jgi:DNA-binding transcriptional regulator YdaS (Cro superfamily)
MSDETVATDTPLQRAIKKAGGVKKLAEALECSPPAIYQWDKVPVERAIQIERLTGISRQELRPDIFGEAA